MRKKNSRKNVIKGRWYNINKKIKKRLVAKYHKITLASFINSNEQDEIWPLKQKGIGVNTILYPRNQQSVKDKISSVFRNSLAASRQLRLELYHFHLDQPAVVLEYVE